MEEINSWTNDPPLIQIGGGGFNGFSQSSFLSNYASNWELEQKEKMAQELEEKINEHEKGKKLRAAADT